MLTYAETVTRQRDDLPAVYGDVDFGLVPERFDAGATLDDARFAPMRSAVARVLEQPELMETIRNATMTGDRVADAYAALIPVFGLRKLIDMVEEACARGVESVADAPPSSSP